MAKRRLYRLAGRQGLLAASNQVPCSTIAIAARAAVESLEPRKLLSATISFAAPLSAGTNSDPIATAVGDINGDGKTDIVVANAGTVEMHAYTQLSSISVLLGNGNGTFEPETTLPYAAQDLKLADLAGDGKEDLVTVDDSTIRILLNNGLGDFTLGETFTIPDTGNGIGVVSRIEVADLTGNGKLDIVALTSTGIVSVLMGNGEGTFAAPYSFASVGEYATSLALADVNGDEKPDVIVGTDAPTNEIDVFLNNGNGTFQAPKVIDDGAFNLAVADVNGDGKPDLVVADGSGVNILLGYGDGTFKPEETFATSASVTSVTVADLNGDGVPDIVATTYKFRVQEIDVLQGNGNGTFAMASTFYGGYMPAQISVGDFNGDGRLDLAVSAANTSGILVPSTRAVTVLLNTTPLVPTSANFALLNDGDLTIAGTPGNDAIDVFGGSSGSIAVYESNFGLDTFVATSISEIAIDAGAGNDSISLNADLPTTIPLINVHGGEGNDTIMAVDGNNHLIRGGGGQNSIVGGSGNDTIFGGQSFAASASSPTGFVGSTVAGGAGNDSLQAGAFSLVEGQQGNDTVQALGDLTEIRGGQGNDSLVSAGAPYGDVLFGGAGNDTVANTTTNDTITGGVGANLTLPAAVLSTSETFFGATTASKIVTADVNGDGVPDLIETDEQNDSVVVLLGNSNGTFKAPYTVAIDGDSKGLVDLAVADINMDGKPDIFVSTFDAPNTNSPPVNEIYLLKGNGNGTFAAPQTFVTSFSDVFTVADVNGDGKPDVIVAGARSYGPDAPALGYAAIYLGNGNGTFQAPNLSSISFGYVQTTSIAAADVNGDGKLDLVATTEVTNPAEQVLSAFLGNGDGTFAGQASSLNKFGSEMTFAVNHVTSTSAADLNADGKADLAVIEDYLDADPTLKLFISNGDGSYGTQKFDLGTTNLEVPAPQLAVADVNGDGKPDLVVSVPAYNLVDVFLSDGHGNFTPPETFPVANETGPIVVDHPTADGPAAIVVGTTGGVTVLST